MVANEIWMVGHGGINVVENYWFSKSNNILCEARGRHKEKVLTIEKRLKGENQISFLIIDICFHFIL